MPSPSPAEPAATAAPRPNFFIVGAPRCGTTALHQYISTHPDIFMSEPKEPLYWADDFPQANQSSYTPLRSLDDYLALFARAQPRHRIVGEATATYLYSQRAIGRIAAFAPDARYVVMLRDPLELVYSWHAELLYNYYEDEPDFAAAWELQSRRAAGERIPRDCFVPQFLQYEQVGRLGAQVERMLASVPARQVKFILFDDFARDPGRAYREVLEFLDLRDDGRDNFDLVNQAKRVRFRALGRLLFHPPRPLAPLIRAVRRAYAQSDPALKTTLSRLTRRPVARPSLSPRMRQVLADTFRTDVHLLGEKLGRDLSSWSSSKARTAAAVSAA